MADALSRTFSGMRFRQRGKRQPDLMNTLLSAMFDVKNQDVLNSCIVTADCNYRIDDFTKIVTIFRVSSAFVMRDHFYQVHIFVAASALDPYHRDIDTGTESSAEHANKAVPTTSDSSSPGDASIVADLASHPDGTETDKREDWLAVSEGRTIDAD